MLWIIVCTQGFEVYFLHKLDKLIEEQYGCTVCTVQVFFFELAEGFIYFRLPLLDKVYVTHLVLLC